MAKKGFLSWLGLGRSADDTASPIDAAPEAVELDPSPVTEVDNSSAGASTATEAIQDAESYAIGGAEPQPETEAEAEAGYDYR
jgi:hypothetical protein